MSAPRIPDEHPYCPIPLSKVGTLSKHELSVADNFAFSMDDKLASFAHAIERSGTPVFVRVPQKSTYSWRRDDQTNAPSIFLMNWYSPGGTRGEMGGDRSDRYSNDASDIPKFEGWNRVLSMFWSDISHLDQKNLEDVVMTTVTWNVNEYYGDSSDYVAEMIDLEKLYKILKKENKLVAKAPAQSFNRFQAALEENPNAMVSLHPPASASPSVSKPKVK